MYCNSSYLLHIIETQKLFCGGDMGSVWKKNKTIPPPRIQSFFKICTEILLALLSGQKKIFEDLEPVQLMLSEMNKSTENKGELSFLAVTVIET